MKRSLLCLAATAALAAGAAQADAILYNGPNFSGAQLALPGDHPNLQGTGFYDTVSSIEITSGRWKFCSQPEYRGDCEVLGPGRYATLPRSLNHRIESVQVVDRMAYAEPPRYVERGYEPPRYVEREAYAVAPPQPARSWGSIELYAEPRFRGPSTRLRRDAWSLENRGFDDRASSVIVREGRWELCTREGHRGACAVYGPGDYPFLGERMDDRVSSVRRVG